MLIFHPVIALVHATYVIMGLHGIV